jgi:hypothetical protein
MAVLRKPRSFFARFGRQSRPPYSGTDRAFRAADRAHRKAGGPTPALQALMAAYVARQGSDDL